MSKQFKSALRRLRNGIHIYRKDCPFPARAMFRVEYAFDKYRGIILTADGTQIIELWETSSLDLLRRIACGYYPAVAKAFGPARNFIGV